MVKYLVDIAAGVERKPGWYLVVSDRYVYDAWCKCNGIDQTHAVFVDESILVVANFWERTTWKIVTPRARKRAPFTDMVVDRLKAMGFKQLNEGADIF